MASPWDGVIVEAVLQREVNVVVDAAPIGCLIPASTRVRAVMHRGVIACGPDCPGLRVAQIMAAHRIHSVVVSSQGVAPRIVTDAEIAQALYDGTLATRSATEIAKPAPIVARDDTLLHASECMHAQETTHAVVVDDRRSVRAVGVLSVLDIAEVLVEASGP
jgi:predicted transcriptional regulator